MQIKWVGEELTERGVTAQQLFNMMDVGHEMNVTLTYFDQGLRLCGIICPTDKTRDMFSFFFTTRGDFIAPRCSHKHPCVIFAHNNNAHEPGWLCKSCGEKHIAQKERWICKPCREDYCFTCRPADPKMRKGDGVTHEDPNIDVDGVEWHRIQHELLPGTRALPKVMRGGKVQLPKGTILQQSEWLRHRLDDQEISLPKFFALLDSDIDDSITLVEYYRGLHKV